MSARRRIRLSTCTGLATLAAVLLITVGAGAQQNADSMGRLHVTPQKIAGYCQTMVSPHSPSPSVKDAKPAAVVVMVEISRNGTVSPLRVLSGPSELQTEAMNTVRLWRYLPYMREGVAVDVTTELTVTFTPGRPAGFVTHPNGPGGSAT